MPSEIAVRLRHDHITMSFFGTSYTKYQKIDNRCRIFINGRGDSIVNGDYMEVFKKDYIETLFLVARIEDFDRFHAKLSFDALQPPAEKPLNPADFHRFSDLLKTLETPDKKPLHVFVLDFSGMKIDVSCHIMSLVQPGFLKYVGIRSSYETMDYHAIYKSMVEMEQWKMAKNLCVKEKFDFPLVGLFNAERVDLHRKGITPADLTRLKEGLLENKTLDYFFINFPFLSDSTRYEAAFGQCHEEKEESKRWFFEVPDSQTKCLEFTYISNKLSHTSTTNQVRKHLQLIKFSRINKTGIENAAYR
ncbi:hypothetical protein CAEBREN_09664 [Caenorhabditis brenneri]|uniref:DUF38 domain-containing protein n=1 Tax=Caenorhabditis brenneri TaxID=135651 RepID=G0NTP4_CAEBE|nr:hypothetical protein CAEBREN_09664 [Caenorhabditis brenneri]